MPALIKVEETGQNEQQFLHAKISQTCTIFCQTKLLKQLPKAPFLLPNNTVKSNESIEFAPFSQTGFFA